MGLPELITGSLEEYSSLALRLAEDAAYLGALRSRLAAHRQTSRLFDAGEFAGDLEKAYIAIWENCGRRVVAS